MKTPIYEARGLFKHKKQTFMVKLEHDQIKKTQKV